MQRAKIGWPSTVVIFGILASVGCASRPDRRADAPKLTVATHASSEANASVNSYLIMGNEHALLVDTQLVVSETAALIEMIRASGKTLETVWITHPHPDHFMGIGQIMAAFPNARVLARPEVAQAMPALFAKYEKPLNDFFPGDVAKEVPAPQAFEGDALTLDGVAIEILDFGGGEAEFTTALHVPSLRAVFCADMVYNHVHPWLNEMRIDGVLDDVERVRDLDGVEQIYPGHGAPMRKSELDAYVQYVHNFVEQVGVASDSEALITTITAKYPDYKTQAGLRFSAAAHMAAGSPPQ